MSATTPQLDVEFRHDHARMGQLFQQVLEACHANAYAKLRELWNELESRVLTHMELEEQTIFRSFAEVDRDEAVALQADHDRIRIHLQELGRSVESYRIREEAAQAFINTLIAHAAREDVLLYRWAQEHLPPETAAQLVNKLRERIHAPQFLERTQEGR